MTKQQMHDHLQAMVGKSYQLNDRVHKILQFKIDPFKVSIATDVDFLEFSAKEAPAEIRKFKPVAGEVLQALSKLPRSEEVQQLNHVLMDTIEKLRTEGGKEYIAQAHAINDVVKNVIELEKTNIQAHILMHGLQNGSKGKALKSGK